MLKTTGDGPQSKMIGHLLDVTGTLTIPTEPATVVDLSTCFAFDGKEQIKNIARTRAASEVLGSRPSGRGRCLSHDPGRSAIRSSAAMLVD